jgi:hypothetical protein
MPPAIAAAGITAAGSVAGGEAAAKGAGKAAKIQATNDAANRAQEMQLYNDAVTRDAPEINYGNSAENTYNGLLGNGSDPAASQKAFNTWLGSTNYNFDLNNAMNAVNSNAYATGLGRSGATYKALQTQGGNVANSYLQNYLGDLQNSVNTGVSAKNALTGVQTNVTNGIIQSGQNAANAASSAATATGGNMASMWQNLGNLAANTYQSSYGNSSLPNFQFGSTAPISVNNNSDYSEG